MDFLHVDSENPSSAIDSLRVNWYYRPRDVQRFNSDTRLVYGTMHSDLCPLTSLRGKCIIKHRSEINDLEAYRKERDSFYFVQVFDRFIRRWYECIPVAQIINVPERVKKALDERWKFVVVEIGRVKELTSAVKTCKRCTRFCASQESVDCAICKSSYHMNCVQPPLPKKPSRGFAWACGPCSRQHESRNTPNASGTEAEEEIVEEEDQTGTSNDNTQAPSPSGSDVMIDDHPATQAEIALAKMWPMRYLGIHARVEDALQYDDRAIYPRASSRLGPRHQANVNIWHGRQVELVKPAEIKKRYTKGASSKTQGKLTKETLAAIEADREEKARRPKWVQDEPPGYVARGEDYANDDPRCTARLMFKMPEVGMLSERGMDEKSSAQSQEEIIDDYLKKARPMAKTIGVPPFGTNFLDKALQLLSDSGLDAHAALKKLQNINRVNDLHEPVLSKVELAKFEEGVAKFGSEHRLVRLHMKTTLPNADIVRFYYLWKKTPKGREIWGSYGGRKGAKRKIDTDSGAKLQAEVVNDADDSAFDNDKAIRRNRSFICKFCNTQHARQWRKAPGVSAGQTVWWESKNGNKDKKEKHVIALCLRCAGLWRKYAIEWEDIDEVAKKVASGGGRALKRKIDEELLRELLIASETTSMSRQDMPVPSIEGVEPPKKKAKTDALPMELPKKKERPPPPPKEPTPPPPPIIPAQPSMRVLPCAVCKVQGDTVACSHCMLTVHRRCFGLGETDGVKANGEVNWICEQCQNDRNPTVSTNYACCLCLTEETLIDLVEPPKVSHKKKTDREKEKERMEKELRDEMRAEYRSKQVLMNRPTLPREPLKRTTGNNWVHVHCAMWTSEIRFSDAKAFEIAEGFQSIPLAKWDAVCKLCKNRDHQNKVQVNAGVCISCFHCHSTFHASCALEAGYQFGFDVTPVKGSRKDQVITASLGEETGALTAAVWCKEHVVKTVIHPIHEPADGTGRTALQVYAENYKQADLTLTGTVRKANLVQLTKDKGQQPAMSTSNINRRESNTHSIAAAVRRGARTSSIAGIKADGEDDSVPSTPNASSERHCANCHIDVTPKWHEVNKAREPTPPPSPQRKMSIAIGETTVQDKQRSADSDMPMQNTLNDRPINVPVDDAPPMNHSLAAESNSNNIRFMAPGANGRAWEGMPDRYSRASPAIITSNPPTAESMGDNSKTGTGPITIDKTSQAISGSACPSKDDGYHNHALPQYQNPAVGTSVSEQNKPEISDSGPPQWLCHKCFLRKKLDPSPPAEQSPIPSPPSAKQLEWQLNPPQQEPPRAVPPPREQSGIPPPYTMPWENVAHQGSGPSPSINGTSLPQSYGPPNGLAPRRDPYGPPPPLGPYGQPNGFHHVAPGHGPPPPHMHERHRSFGYGPPPPAYGHQRLPPYPPTNQPMQGGGQHQPAHSPSTMYGHPQHHYAPPPRRTQSPFSQQLPPLGQPMRNSSPTISMARPDQNMNMASQLPSNIDPQLSQSYSPHTNGAVHIEQTHNPPPAQHTSPQISHAHGGPSTHISRPETPARDGAGSAQPNNGSNVGASASPNLIHLLHP
nr:lid2 complex component snt2 [Quercus suber]